MTTRVSLLLAAAVAWPALASAQPAPDRDGLAVLAHRLEVAAARVSVATPGFLGSSSTRAYRVPGVGAVVVLAPRVLAATPSARVLLPLAMAPASRSAAASRAELERALFEFRSSLERASGPLPTARVVTDTDLRALERDAQERLAAAARARAEAFRALADAMSTMPDMPHVTLGPMVAPGTPLGGAATRPGRPLDTRPTPRPDDTVSRVRTALRAALPDLREMLAALPETESISVAVDFVAPGSWPGSAPQRTLVVRARVADVRAAQPESEIPVEVLEY